ncbi:putative histone deacetylase HOS2 [Diplonema papillatum]|nr:putative histone deacetylase HOS2 [Diplonema papillatum]
MAETRRRTLGLVHDGRHVEQCRNPRHPDRAALVHAMIRGFGFGFTKLSVTSADKAEAEEAIELYHSPTYVRAIKPRRKRMARELAAASEPSDDDDDSSSTATSSSSNDGVAFAAPSEAGDSNCSGSSDMCPILPPAKQNGHSKHPFPNAPSSSSSSSSSSSYPAILANGDHPPPDAHPPDSFPVPCAQPNGNDAHRQTGDHLPNDAHRRTGDHLPNDAHRQTGDHLPNDVHRRTGDHLPNNVHRQSGDHLPIQPNGAPPCGGEFRAADAENGSKSSGGAAAMQQLPPPAAAEAAAAGPKGVCQSGGLAGGGGEDPLVLLPPGRTGFLAGLLTPTKSRLDGSGVFGSRKQLSEAAEFCRFAWRLVGRPPPRILSPRPGVGLAGDCPRFKGVWRYAIRVCGGTVVAAKALTSDRCLRAVHWEGGRHHASHQGPAGYCYVADIVLGVNELVTRYSRVLVIDLDVHHGDGTQEAFYRSSNVFTLSVHMHGAGIYPSTGGVGETGAGPGLGYNLNIPVKTGCADDLYYHAFSRVAQAVKDTFDPSAVVLVCGADVLSGDPVGELNVSLPCMLECAALVRDWGLPTLVLGGGGYNMPLCARYWTCLTWMYGRTPRPESTQAADAAENGPFAVPSRKVDPFDFAAPLLSSASVRELGRRHVEGLASAVPHDAVQEELYAALSPGGNPSLLPPDPMHASHLNTEESIRTLVHFALDALLKAQLNRAVLRGSATNGDRKRKRT